jgi:hypothetical protein
MGIGATTGDKPNYVDDGDLKSLDELRGAMTALEAASLSVGERGTVAGLRTSISVLKQQMVTTHEQMQTLINMYGTLRMEFDQFNQQRAVELNVRVNGGSTTAEDIDAPRSSD